MDPGFITINTAGYCKDCPFMDLSVKTFHSFDSMISIQPIRNEMLHSAEVECKNKDICDRVYHNTVMSLTKGAEGNDS